MRPGPLEDPVILAIAARVGKTPAQVLLAWAVQRGTALLTTPRSAARARENFDISALPEDALEEIDRIQTRQRLNQVVTTGVPGFIPKRASARRRTENVRPAAEADFSGRAFSAGLKSSFPLLKQEAPT
jgi:alcohol dehydrogenase (NADP+)